MHEVVYQLLGEPVGEVLLVLLHAQVDERQNGDRLLLRCSGGFTVTGDGRGRCRERFCASRADESVAQRPDQQCDRCRGRREPAAVAQRELGEAVADAIGARFYGLHAQTALQIVGERGGAVVATRRCLRERLQDDCIQVAPEAPRQLSLRRASLASGAGRNPSAGSINLNGGDRVLQLRDRGTGLEMIWPVSGEQLVEDHPQRVHVAGCTELFAPHQLRACIVRGQNSAVALREVGLLLFPGQQLRYPEVQQPHLPRIGHQDVRRLDIPVNDSLSVCILHRVQHL